jgi:hypothetical protein
VPNGSVRKKGAAMATVKLAHTVASMGDATGAVLAENQNRKYALVINDSDAVVYLKVGAAAVENQGIRLSATGGSFEMSSQTGNLDKRAINGITASGTKVLVVTEGT